MLRTHPLTLAALLGALALPVAAGSWPNVPSSKGRLATPDVATADAPAAAKKAAVPTATRDGFEFVGGDTGWRLAQHKYVRSGGRFMHSQECDHAMRTALAPTPDEVDAARKMSPGG